jgi:hypothetical protein
MAAPALCGTQRKAAGHFPTCEDLILRACQYDIERMTVTADEVQTRSASAKAVFVEWSEMLSTHHPPQAGSR